jgi:hypothetical protein
MNEGRHEFEQRIEAYLDGGLSAGDRAELERQLATDVEARAAVSRQHAIDDALRRQFQSVLLPRAMQDDRPSTRSGPLTVPRRRSSPAIRAAQPRLQPRATFALAAALVFAVIGGWLIWHALAPSPPKQGPYDQAWRSLETVYRDVIAAGFQPEWECRDEREFAESFATLYGQSLALAPMPEGSGMLGLAYSHSLSPRTTCLLARVDEQPVLVFIDRAERDFAQSLSDSSGLNQFRTQVGRLVIYELSPLAEPRVLPHLHSPGLTGEPSSPGESEGPST